MSFENRDFRRDIRVEAGLGACTQCPELVLQLNELQDGVDVSMQRLRAALSDRVKDEINRVYVNFNKEWDDPEGRDVPPLSAEVLEREVVRYRQTVAENIHHFDGYVTDHITSMRDTCRNCKGPLQGEIKLGRQTVRVTVCGRPDAPSGTSYESAWVDRD